MLGDDDMDALVVDAVHQCEAGILEHAGRNLESV
jgi:hypothetical protein